VPAIVDGADDLEALALDCATAKIHPEDWNQLSVARPHLAESIRDLRVRLTWTIFQPSPQSL
ncbi:MAG: ATP-dependent DNA helicase, partial [Coleofasciculaceae cyanobacterium SM2_3_26]|nr:ATP-dependent DNA helicase [Coleofasciculaceae cyanobacterium SM2_3_26]